MTSVETEWPASHFQDIAPTTISATQLMERKILPGGKKKKKVKAKRKKRRPLDTAALELAAENAKKDLLEFLRTKIDLSEEEILIAYDEFHKKYPAGEINKTQFLAQSKVSPNLTVEILISDYVGRTVYSRGPVQSV